MIWPKIRRFLRNPYFARSSHDRAAFTILLIGAQLALWYETCHVMQYYHPSLPDEDEARWLAHMRGGGGSYGWIAHVAFALYLYANSLANVYKMIRTRVACDLTAIGVSEDPSWPYCERCICHRPPRTHHCPVCDVCVLKRDHHCWFGGCCIGHGNHRYYLCAIAYMFIAALYSNFYHWSFMRDRFEHLGGFGTAVCITIPHFCAMFGYLTFYQFLIAVLSFISLLLLVMFAWLLAIQVSQMSHGQTRHERRGGDITYDSGPLNNIQSVFGERWYIAWLCPWISSPLPGNGAVFTVYNVKSK